jgi:polar amino acid transport system substrate-binding protein
MRGSVSFIRRIAGAARLLVPVVLMLLPYTGRADGELILGGTDWPPFVIEGDEEGTAEKLVCTAFRRAGWSCAVKTAEWSRLVDDARSGAIGGLVGVWRNRELSQFLLFSKPYLSNRIVPVVNRDAPAGIASIEDLAGLRVALVQDYAYGDEIDDSQVAFQRIASADFLSAMQAVRDGRADVALVDELVALHELEKKSVDGVTALKVALADNELRFAVPVDHPQASRLLEDFHRAYQSMLEDGTVNEILEIDWVASDFGHIGRTDLVLRTGVKLDQVAHPDSEGAVYSLGRSRYESSPSAQQDDSRVQYRINGTEHSSLQQAINTAFGREIGCEHKEFSSEFDCTGLLKK